MLALKIFLNNQAFGGGNYPIRCGNCPSSYVGETSRQIKIRTDEHLKGNNPSAFRAHLNSNGHSYEEDCISILHVKSDYRRRLALEHIEIVKTKDKSNLTLLNNFTLRSLVSLKTRYEGIMKTDNLSYNIFWARQKIKIMFHVFPYGEGGIQNFSKSQGLYGGRAWNFSKSQSLHGSAKSYISTY